MTVERSAALLERAAALIPAYTQTLSKNPTQWVRGFAPAYIARGKGAHVWDVDGNRFIDFPMGLGAIILGHADERVNEAIRRQLDDGIVFTLPNPIELEVAERVVAKVPCAERVRFAKAGSDANTAAIRLARAATGREHVLVAGYHGWHDWYIGSTSRRAGVPQAVVDLVDEFAFNDLASLEDALDRQRGDTAAVILEPAGATAPDDGFLQGVIDRARDAGAISVFDEIITGFRLGPGGAQERYGATPDLATFGKSLANGMPLSAIAGRADLMDGLAEVFFSGTHGGETLSLAASVATLDALDAAAYERIYALGERLRAGVQAAIERAGVGDHVAITGEAPRTVVAVSEPDPGTSDLWAKSLVQQEMLRRGVLFNGSNFICVAHTEDDIDQAIDAYGAAFDRLADGLSGGLADLVEGEPLQPAFRPVK